MTWETGSAIAEMVGAIGVILSLAYLARQIGQTNRIARSSVVRELQQKYDDFYSLVVSDSDVALLVSKLTDHNYRAQTAVEEQRLMNLAGLIASMWFSAQIAYDQGQIGERIYRIYSEDVVARLDQWPALQPYLQKVTRQWPSGVDLKIITPIFE